MPFVKVGQCIINTELVRFVYPASNGRWVWDEEAGDDVWVPDTETCTVYFDSNHYQTFNVGLDKMYEILTDPFAAGEFKEEA